MFKFKSCLKMAMIAAVALAAAPDAWAGGGNEGGKGGVVIRAWGQIRTIWEADALPRQTEVEEDLRVVPGLNELISDLNVLIPGYDSVVNEILLPSPSRHYFRARKSEMNDREIHRIRQVYSKVLNLPESKIEVVAYTFASEAQIDTYFTEVFFKLKPEEQLQVNFHEFAWGVPYKTPWRTFAFYRDYIPAHVTESFVAELEKGYAAWRQYNSDVRVYSGLAYLFGDLAFKLRIAAGIDRKRPFYGLGAYNFVGVDRQKEREIRSPRLAGNETVAGVNRHSLDPAWLNWALLQWGSTDRYWAGTALLELLRFRPSVSLVFNCDPAQVIESKSAARTFSERNFSCEAGQKMSVALETFRNLKFRLDLAEQKVDEASSPARTTVEIPIGFEGAQADELMDAPKLVLSFSPYPYPALQSIMR